MIDWPLLSKGEDFEDLVDTYVIFITEKDKFGKGIPLYHIERRIEEMVLQRHSGEPKNLPVRSATLTKKPTNTLKPGVQDR